MNKKLLTWLTIGFVGLAFIFSLIGACVSSNRGAVLAMCIIAMLLALAGLVGLLLIIFYKVKQPATTTPKEEPTKKEETTQKEAL